MVRPGVYRLIGSPDLHEHKERGPEESINFITCHDGLTLNDLVSYNGKHNEENGEDNRDGTDNNLSWNCGTEGPTQDPAVEQLRNRQVKNFLTLTLLTVGTPMLLMGDEMRRTQRGNNNAYCQHNGTNWLDWELLVRHADIYRFAKQLISLRPNGIGPIGGSEMTLNELLHRQPVQWQGVRLDAPDWSYDSHSLAATVHLLGDRVVLHYMVNAYGRRSDSKSPLSARPGIRGDGAWTRSWTPQKILVIGPRARSFRVRHIWSSPAPWCFWLLRLEGAQNGARVYRNSKGDTRASHENCPDDSGGA
jgi:glycogen operon protein